MEKPEKRLESAFLYLKKQGKIKYKKDVAMIMSVSPDTISRAFSGMRPYYNPTFLRAFNSSFDNIFNERWLIGEDAPMLADPKLPSQDSPSESLIALAASLIQETDRLRHQLTREIEDIQLLKVELRSAIAMLSKQLPSSPNNPLHSPQDYPTFLAEDKNA